MIINQVGGGGKGYASEAFDINTNTYIYCGESRDVSISSSAYGWRYFPNGSKFSGRLVAADNGEFCIVETEVSSTTNNGKLGNYRQGTVTGSQMNGLLRSVINNSALCDMFRSLHIPSGVPMTIEVYYYAAGSSLFWSEPNPIKKSFKKNGVLWVSSTTNPHHFSSCINLHYINYFLSLIPFNYFLYLIF